MAVTPVSSNRGGIQEGYVEVYGPGKLGLAIFVGSRPTGAGGRWKGETFGEGGLFPGSREIDDV
jgi:hypothetical protein